MIFNASLVTSTVRAAQLALQASGFRFVPALALAVGAGVMTDVIANGTPSYFPLASLAYAVVQLIVQAWVIAISFDLAGVRLAGPGTWRLGSLFVLSLLASLGILLGLVLLILPGLYLAGRWFVAAPAMLAEGQSASQGLSRSGELMRQDWLAGTILAVTFAILRFAPLLIQSLFADLSDASGWALLIVTNIMSEGFGIASFVVSVSLYLLLNNPVEKMVEIFD